MAYSGVLTIATVRGYCRIGGDGEDAVLEAIAAGVEGAVTKFTGRLFAEQTGHEQIIEGAGRYLWPTVGPVTAITSVTLVDTTTAETTTSYALQGDDRVRRVRSDWLDSLYTVVASVGYAAADIPAELMQVMYQLCARAYKGMGSAQTEGAGGHFYTLRQLATTDEMAVLRSYRMGNPA